MRLNALIVDEDRSYEQRLLKVLTERGFSTRWCESVPEAQAWLLDTQPEFALIALDCAGQDGCRLLDSPGLSAGCEVVLTSTVYDRERISRGLTNGARWFLGKPLSEHFLGELLSDLEAENTDPDDAHPAPTIPLMQFGDLYGSAPGMLELYRQLRRVAKLDTTVFLIGESGTGKELAASTLHQLSDRSDQPFLAINCSAVPDALVESELFGHERGSFSGAARRHRGIWERAHRGTLFLDEITEMDPQQQVKLLRVLESGVFRRVGGESDLSADVRIIAATNRSPQSEQPIDGLRQDLYYRLAQFPVQMPPLREREGDIGGLAHLFLNRLNQEVGAAKQMSKAAVETLQRYAWPGNVRELKNAIAQAHVMARQTIESADLPHLEPDPPEQNRSVRVAVGASLKTVENEIIQATLDATEGNKSEAARILGVSVKTIYNRVNERPSLHPADPLSAGRRWPDA